MIISFIGHGKTEMKEKLKRQLQEVIKSNFDQNNTVFFCGGYGNFDNMAAKAVWELKKQFPGIRSVFITPYRTESYLKQHQSSNLYDEILYPNLEKTPPRFAILKRNQFMVEKADLIIAYVKFDWGGAYQSYQYAKKKGKVIINLADMLEKEER